MSLDSAFNFSGRFNVSVAIPPLSSRWTRSLISRLLPTIPPSAAERLKQARGIRVSIGFGLNESEFGLLIGELGVQYCDQGNGPQLALPHRQFEGLFGGPF